MTTNLTFRKTTALATVITFGATVLFAEPAWGQTSRATSPTPTPAAPAAAAPTPASQTRLQIAHDPLACVTTVIAPVVEAKVQPSPDLSVSRVFFRPAGTPYFYYVVMSGAAPDLSGTLPRPLPELKAMDYYVQATDKVSLSRKTPDYAPPVVPGTTCKVKGVAVGKDGAGLTIGLTDASQPPIPPGFNKDDIRFVILVTGAVVTTAVALANFSGGTTATGAGAGPGAAGAGAAGAGVGAAAAGGGISSTVLIVGGVAVAAGVGIAVASGGNGATNTPPSTPTVTRTPTRTPIPNRFIQVEVTWSGLGNVDILLLDPFDVPGGIQNVPAGCESTGARTERAIVQGTSLPSNQYLVRLIGSTCPDGSANPISAILNVATDAGPQASCSNRFIAVPVPGTVDGCLFTLP